MGKFNFEEYRQPWETGPHWELKKEFIETYQDMFEEDRLLCLAQAYANVVLMNCCYPGPVMQQISELSKPLQLRKKFQEVKHSTESSKSNNDQTRVSEKIKSIYEQSGRSSFKQMKFCTSKEQQSHSTTSSQSINPHHSSPEQLKNAPTLFSTSDQDTQNLYQTFVTPPIDQVKEPICVSKQVEFCTSEGQQNNSTSSAQSVNQLSFSTEQLKNPTTLFSPSDKHTLKLSQTFVTPSVHETEKCIYNEKSTESSIKSAICSYGVAQREISPENEKDMKIISALGLPFIQNFANTMKTFSKKIDQPVSAIYCVITKLGLGMNCCSFEINPDLTSPNRKFNAKFFINNCEIAIGTASNKKNAKRLSAENAINTFFRLATSYLSSDEEVLQLFSKNIINRTESEPAEVTLKNIASLLNMDDCIAFHVISSNIFPDVTEYCCKFYLKDILISTCKNSSSQKAKFMAADLGLMKLSNLSKYEIQNNELKEKHNSSNQAFNSEASSSSFFQPSTEPYIEKPPFILNKEKYNLSLKDGFVLIDKENSMAYQQKNEKTILNESASFSHKKFEYEFEDIPGTMPPSKKAVLLIAGAVVGTGVGITKEEAKTVACVKALNDFKKKYYTLRIKNEYIEGFIITRNQVFDGESFSSNVISESNIGCKMLKSMGWTGGGLGEKGIAEPIQATAKASMGSGLGFGESKSPKNSPLFRKRLEAMLRDFCSHENYSDLVFSKDFTKEERKEIHHLAARFHLHTQSRGVGDDRFLTVRQKYETTKLLKFLASNGGSNSKFELIDDSGFSPQV